jgi:tRNA G18 (ribose-2'-O)-methylase SpoU
MKPLRGIELKRFVKEQRKQYHIQRDIVIVLQSVSYPVNVGSIFRIADAFGVSQLALCGSTPTPPHPTISKVGRNKDKVVRWNYHEQVEEVLASLKSDGYFLCAVELTDIATAYFQTHYPQKVCLILGNEDHGITRKVLTYCDSSVYVPMIGDGRSLNVHVCAAIVLAHIQYGIHQWPDTGTDHA